MSQLNVDTITDELGTGAPDFPNGLTGLPTLSQAQAEDDTSTVFGQVSGQRLAQAGVVSFADQEQQIGVGQDWVIYTGTGLRLANTAYQNTTGRPIQVFVALGQNAGFGFQISSDNVTYTEIFGGDGGAPIAGGPIIPNNYYYKINGGVTDWWELR